MGLCVNLHALHYGLRNVQIEVEKSVVTGFFRITGDGMVLLLYTDQFFPLNSIDNITQS